MNVINLYITKRYQYWLDYATYHATLASLPGQGGDILNTVLESLLRKDPEYIKALYEKKKQGYTELDFFVLRMIKLNAHSPTSPYRHKTRTVPTDANVDPWSLEIVESGESKVDKSEIILGQFSKIRKALDNLNIPKQDKDLFHWVFLADNPIRTFPGEGSYSRNCRRFNEVRNLVWRTAAPGRFKIHNFFQTLSAVRKSMLKAAKLSENNSEVTI